MAEKSKSKQEKDMELLSKWLKRYKSSESYCEDFFKEGKDNYKLYKCYKDSSTGTDSYKHNIFVPYSFAFLEDFVSYMMISLMTAPKIFSVSPRGPGSKPGPGTRGISKELALDLEQVINWAIHQEETEFYLEIEEALKGLNIYSVGYILTFPHLDDNDDFDYLHMTAPYPLDIFPEPGAKRLSRANWVIRKSHEDFDALKTQEKLGIYSNVDEAKGYIGDDTEVNKMMKSIGLNPNSIKDDVKSGRVELLDIFQDGHIITIGNRKAIIRNTFEEDYKPSIFRFPLLDARASGAPQEYFGVSLMQSIKPIQKELNLLRSQRRDNVSLLLNKLFVIDMMAGEVDLTTLFSAPGNAILTTNRAAIDELPIHDLTESSYKEEEALKYDIQNITSLWDYARGATPQRRETATGIVRLQQASQGRTEWLLRKFDLYILQPLARRLIVHLRDHMDYNDFAEICGRESTETADEFFYLEPHKIKRLLSIQPITQSIQSIKEVELNQFIQAFDRLISLPEVNRAGLIKLLLLKLGNRNIKEILPQLSDEAQSGVIDGMGQLQERNDLARMARKAALEGKGGEVPPSA